MNKGYCKVCGKELKLSNRKYCSRKCYVKDRKGKHFKWSKEAIWRHLERKINELED